MQLKAKQAFLQHPESLEYSMSISELICLKKLNFLFDLQWSSLSYNITKHVITQLSLAYKDALLPDKYLHYTTLNLMGHPQDNNLSPN